MSVQCMKCGLFKPIGEFQPCQLRPRRGKRSLRRRCKECVKNYAKEYKTKYPDRVQASLNKSRTTYRGLRQNPITWSATVLNDIKQRAKKRGLECNLEASDLVVPGHCPVLGIKLEVNRGKGGVRHNSPSIDRFDNTKGYVRGNVFVISNRANILKRDATVDEIRALLAYMEGKIAFPQNSTQKQIVAKAVQESLELRLLPELETPTFDDLRTQKPATRAGLLGSEDREF